MTASWPSGCGAVSLALYQFAADHARARGIILADTKFEFGLDADGVLTLGDEVCTPDSSRFWPADTYEPGRSQPSFDKQFARDWATSTGWDKLPPAPEIPDDVVARTREKYIEAYERITGNSFADWVARTRGGELDACARPDPTQGRDPRPAGTGGRARAPGAGLQRRRRRSTSGGWSSSTSRTRAQLPAMCERLLANPLIEDYEIIENA